MKEINRRNFLTRAAGLGAVTLFSSSARLLRAADEPITSYGKGIVVSTNKLTVPRKGSITVAVAISEGATVIDFAGPWDVFGSVMVSERGRERDDQMPFRLFTVSEKTKAVTVENGMKLVPDYTFANAPASQVVVVPAQRSSDALTEWLRKAGATADVTMSVCTGVFQIAKAGLLKGKSATTHHDHYDHFARQFPDIDLKRGVRFVENEKVSASGGETCGIDLSLRVVERYFGREVARRTAVFIEHQGEGWIV